MLRRSLGWSGAALAVAVLVAVPVPLAAQAQPAKKPTASSGASARKFVPKRMPWGDPDISGNFTTKNELGTPMERPEQFAGKRIEDITPEELAAINRTRQQQAVESAPYAGGGSRARGVALGVPIHWLDHLDAENNRPWLVVDPPDGRIPPLAQEAQQARAVVSAARAQRGTADSFTDRSLWDRCIVRSAPTFLVGFYGASFQILQTKDYVAIRYEMVHEARIVPIEGRGASRPHNSPALRGYFGDSIARWEGDTLVVDSANFSKESDYRGANQHLHLIERFTRNAANKVEVTTTVEDPHTWTRPWTYSIPLTEDDGSPIFEYACHEGNYGLRNILSAGRSDDRKGIKSSNSADAQADLKGEFDE